MSATAPGRAPVADPADGTSLGPGPGPGGVTSRLARAARIAGAADARRVMLGALGLLWLLDGALQLQSFMYTTGFTETLREGAAGQPLWLERSITWAVGVVQHDLGAWNTVFALVQISIGVGLLYRPTARAALVLSFAWAFVVWWFAESFGMLFMMMATPLGGAPGAVILYALAGLILWPGLRPAGVLGVRGARSAWAVLWLLMAWLWLQGQNSSPGAVSHAIRTAPSGMGWLSSVEHWAASAAEGNGLWIALMLAALSAAIGVAVAVNWHPKPFLALAIGLNLAYWVLGQGFGGIFTGQATDPNAAPLFVLLACALHALAAHDAQPARDASGPNGAAQAVA
ncbi:MAG: hypothetical protein KGJ43_01415 [Acidobacteriota bacterium]|nr:hypothetical protein [Acidobacteriota bacterium]